MLSNLFSTIVHGKTKTEEYNLYYYDAEKVIRKNLLRTFSATWPSVLEMSAVASASSLEIFVTNPKEWNYTFEEMLQLPSVKIYLSNPKNLDFILSHLIDDGGKEFLHDTSFFMNKMVALTTEIDYDIGIIKKKLNKLNNDYSRSNHREDRPQPNALDNKNGYFDKLRSKLECLIEMGLQKPCGTFLQSIGRNSFLEEIFMSFIMQKDCMFLKKHISHCNVYLNSSSWVSDLLHPQNNQCTFVNMSDYYRFRTLEFFKKFYILMENSVFHNRHFIRVCLIKIEHMILSVQFTPVYNDVDAAYIVSSTFDRDLKIFFKFLLENHYDLLLDNSVEIQEEIFDRMGKCFA